MSARGLLLCAGCALVLVPPCLAEAPKNPPPALQKQHELKLPAWWLAINAKGTELLACVGTDVKVLDTSTFKVKKTLIATGRRAAFTLEDKALVVSGVFQSGIELLDRRSGESVLLNQGDNDFSCHGGSNLLAYRGRGKVGSTINVYDVAKKKLLARFEVDDPVSKPVLGGFSDKGVLLAGFTKDRVREGRLIVTGYLLVWSPPYDKDPVTIECEKEARSLAISPDGRHAAVGTATGLTQVWDLGARKRLRTLRHSHAGPVEVVAFSPDGRLCASLVTDVRTRKTGRPRGYGNSEVILLNLKTGRPAEPVEVDKKLTLALVFFPDGQRLATSGDGGLKVWKIAEHIRKEK
jgi:WD40 repeat protein